MPQSLAETDITGINVVGRVRKHLKVMFSSSNMKSAIVQGARLSEPTNFYVSEYLTRKPSTLLYILRIMKIENSYIRSVYSRNGTVNYKQDSDDTDQQHRKKRRKKKNVYSN